MFNLDNRGNVSFHDGATTNILKLCTFIKSSLDYIMILRHNTKGRCKNTPKGGGVPNVLGEQQTLGKWWDNTFCPRIWGSMTF